MRNLPISPPFPRMDRLIESQHKTADYGLHDCSEFRPKLGSFVLNMNRPSGRERLSGNSLEADEIGRCTVFRAKV